MLLGGKKSQKKHKNQTLEPTLKTKSTHIQHSYRDHASSATGGFLDGVKPPYLIRQVVS